MRATSKRLFMCHGKILPPAPQAEYSNRISFFLAISQKRWDQSFLSCSLFSLSTHTHTHIHLLSPSLSQRALIPSTNEAACRVSSSGSTNSARPAGFTTRPN